MVIADHLSESHCTRSDIEVRSFRTASRDRQRPNRHQIHDPTRVPARHPWRVATMPAAYRQRSVYIVHLPRSSCSDGARRIDMAIRRAECVEALVDSGIIGPKFIDSGNEAAPDAGARTGSASKFTRRCRRYGVPRRSAKGQEDLWAMNGRWRAPAAQI
jgi:hypothetical protein